MPAEFVSTGLNLGWISSRKPFSSTPTFIFCASSSTPSAGRMAVASTTRSASMVTGVARQRIGPAHDQLAVLLSDLRNPPAIVLCAVLLDGAAHELVVAFAACADVHVEDVRLAVVHLVLVKHGVLGRVHAADLRAVGHALGVVARAHAGDEHHVLRRLAVGGPLDFAAGRPGCGNKPLELQRVDHVFVFAVTVFAVAGGLARLLLPML